MERRRTAQLAAHSFRRDLGNDYAPTLDVGHHHNTPAHHCPLVAEVSIAGITHEIGLFIEGDKGR